MLSISKRAKIDIEEIWLYTFQNWSQTQADKYFEEISNALSLIQQNYKAGTPHVKSQFSNYKFLVKSHIIFYYVNEEKKILIQRILHQKMDPDQHII